MKAQISEGFGSEWLILHNSKEYQGKEGVAVILFPETDLLSFLSAKKLYELMPYDNPLKKVLGKLIQDIDKRNQEIVEAGTWDK